MKPIEVPEWPKQEFKERLHMCRRLLFVHGFITDYYNTVLKKRIDNSQEKPNDVTKLA